MTITATTTQSTGAPGAAGTQIGTQAIAAPSTWTKLTTLGTIPAGGAVLTVTSDAEAFRVAIMEPDSIGDASGADRQPRTNGILVNRFGATSEGYKQQIVQNAQVWVKQA